MFNKFLKLFRVIKKYFLGNSYYPRNEFNMLYFIPYSNNFGDELNEYIIKKMISNSDTVVHFINLAAPKRFIKELKSFSLIGSIMHHLPKNTDIIGSGVNPNYPNINKNLNILALRGDLSKQYLISKLDYKIDKIIFGDPALLIPRLFPEWLDPLPLSEKEIGIIPHFNDIPHFETINNNDINLNYECCYPNQSAKVVIDFIRTKKIIISSSLHGLILSEMLGKEVKWVMFEGSLKSESEFKYVEYFYSTNRFNIKYAKTINEAISSVIPKPVYDDSQLYDILKNYLSIDK